MRSCTGVSELISTMLEVLISSSTVRHALVKDAHLAISHSEWALLLLYTFNGTRPFVRRTTYVNIAMQLQWPAGVGWGSLEVQTQAKAIYEPSQLPPRRYVASADVRLKIALRLRFSVLTWPYCEALPLNHCAFWYERDATSKPIENTISGSL